MRNVQTGLDACAAVPIVGFSAPSGTGKTTLLRAVLVLLRERGLRVGVIKQARDDFDVDVPGTDSFELRRAGIEATVIASDRQSALICERPESIDPELSSLLPEFAMDDVDLILVEGFSDQPFPKIELFRGQDQPRYLKDPWIIALATDCKLPYEPPIPLLEINDPAAVADFLAARVFLRNSD